MGTVINVAGTSRSGSTVLHLMLANSPGAFACGEVVNWYRPEKRHHFVADCACGSRECSVWKRLRDVPENMFYQEAARRFAMEYLVDSSKDICWLVDAERWARQSSLARHLVFVWKDPVDLAFSFWKRGLGADYWRSQMVRYYEKVLQLELPFVSVSQAELSRSPAEKVRQVCKVVGLPYFEGKERFWEKQHHFLFGSSSVRTQAVEGPSRTRSAREFPAEFRALLPALEERIGDDDQVQRILAVLAQRDVGRLASAEPQAWRASGRGYPLWYYGKKARRRFRRYFPLQTPPGGRT